MGINSIKLKPGVTTQLTPTLAEAQITDSNLIRFKDGVTQKYGGWQKYYPFSMGSVPRALKAWEGLTADIHLAVGSEASLVVITNNFGEDITPQKRTSNNAPNFSTVNGSAVVTVVDAASNTSVFMTIYLNTPIAIDGLVLQGAYRIASVLGVNSYTITAASNATATVNNAGTVPSFATTTGSSTVTVTLNNHGKVVNDPFTVLVPTTVGGIPLTGLYRVNTVVGANSFTIIAASQATSTTSGSENAGNAQIVYYVALGPPTPGSGYGVGAYGSGGYGTGTTAPLGQGTPITAVDWTLDNFSDTLVACPKNGAIYYWTPGSGFVNAQVVSFGPIINGGVFVAMPQQQLVAWASEGNRLPASFGNQDPLMVRWSDVGNFTLPASWIASNNTQAGSYRLATGSRIVGGLQGPSVGLLWTDIDLWTMTYIGFQNGVFGFVKIASGCGLISQAAACVLGTKTYWMSGSQFFSTSGAGVTGIPCTVWDAVFQDLDRDNQYKIRSAPNSLFNEVAWFYPSLAGTGEIDSYVKYNTDGLWDKGKLVRTAWIDQSVINFPIATDSAGFIYQHESSQDGDGVAINAYIQTGYFMISEGDSNSFVDWLLPDMRWGLFGGTQDADMIFTFQGVKYPNDAQFTKGPYAVNTSSRFIPTRIRAREISMRVESNDLGSFWRMGNMRSRIAPAGRGQ